MFLKSFSTFPARKVAAPTWPNDVVENFAEILKRNDSFVFTPTRTLDKHVFGEMKFKNQDKLVSLGQIFIELSYATDSIDGKLYVFVYFSMCGQQSN